MIRADDSLRYLKGVGPRRADALARQGVETVEDLVYHLPFRWEDRSAFARVGELEPRGPLRTLEVEIERTKLISPRGRRGFSIFRAWVADSSGSIEAVWFNQPYLARVLEQGRRAVLHGRAEFDRSGRFVLVNPEYELLDEEDAERVHTGRIVPVYRKIGDLSSRTLRTLIWRALADVDPVTLADIVPADVAGRHELPPRIDALRHVHFPPAGSDLAALAERSTETWRALVFEEIFVLQLALAVRRRRTVEEKRGIAYRVDDALLARLAAGLPFELTGAQRRVLDEIAADLRSGHPMNRLLQGDVGSGKTVVALLAMLVAVDNGYQAALMAPTEILAEQHYRTIGRLLGGAGGGPRAVVLTGSLGAATRRRVLGEMKSGTAELVLGTHALFEADAEFRKLGLVVVDEQHRFGVLQRAALAAKGLHPDVLVMTATPIPRSLALTLYGDLDLSVIDALPPGRTPVKTVVRREAERAQVWAGIRQALAAGRQVYVVVPLVEETEKSDLKAAVDFAAHLARDIFPEFAVGILHGRLKGPQKDAVMRGFVEGTTQMLVATTVIEVGVDVPNANVMVVEHAERFGLSQLHQLRGRVGRGAGRSYCVLMVGEGYGEEAGERLSVMERTNDGFEIAEKDLDLRGPGAVFGTQQHGLPDLRFLAQVLRRPQLLDAARLEAYDLVAGAGGRETAQRLLGSLGGKWRRRLELAAIL